jgi:5-methyltetrahydrofolate corrinoid/iron sulfur protein methyltransferase
MENQHIMQIIADNLNIMQPAVARALEDRDPGPVRHLVRRCAAAGAQALDINTGPLSRQPREQMTFLVEAVQSAVDLPLVLDTVNPDAMEAGLAACTGRVTINGFSLEPHKLADILPLAGRFGADVIGYVLGAHSRVPMVEHEMMATAVAMFEAYTKAGLAPGQLIIDPVVVPAAWPDGSRHNRGVLSLISRLPELLGTPVRTIAGLSNLSSGGGTQDAKMALEAGYLPMLAAAGLDMILANVFHSKTMAVAKVCGMLLKEGVFSWADLDSSRIAITQSI